MQTLEKKSKLTYKADKRTNFKPQSSDIIKVMKGRSSFKRKVNKNAVKDDEFTYLCLKLDGLTLKSLKITAKALKMTPKGYLMSVLKKSLENED